MSCGKCTSGSDFSDLKDTWSKKSSLNTNDWNPYPELERGRENPSHNSKEGYKTYPWVRPTNYNDLSKTWNVQKPYNL